MKFKAILAVAFIFLGTLSHAQTGKSKDDGTTKEVIDTENQRATITGSTSDMHDGSESKKA